LQAPAGGIFRKILTVFAALGLGFVIVGLLAGFIPPPKSARADAGRIVSLYFDGQKKVITTDASTVGAVLQQSGIALAEGDAVEPKAETAIPAGFFNINIYRARPVVVVDGARRVTIKTASQSPSLIAKSAGLTVYPEDEYELSTITQPTSFGVVGQMVKLHRAVPLVINSDGQSRLVRTQQKTVEGVLTERDVALGPQDTVEPARSTAVAPNLTITINRVKIAEVQQKTAIAHDTQTIRDEALLIGDSQVVTPGSDGERASTYRVHFQNGIEQSRQLLSTEVTKAPVTKVVHVGTKINYNANPVELGRQLAAQRGWVDDQWEALYRLWSEESGWNPTAYNGASGACGIPQALPCSKITDRSVNGQIEWGLGYITRTYGTPSAAWSFFQRNHWY
jgi:uncharacterized protein YabE (DUF348 family)